MANASTATNEEVMRALEPRPVAYSEDHLATRFCDEHELFTRYVAQWNRWLFYSGTRWEMDGTKRFFDLARGVCRQAADDYLAMESKPQEGMARALASAKTVAAVVSLASSDPRITAVPEQWDCDPFLLNTPGGTVNLKTGELKPHRRLDYLTKSTAVTPSDDTACPTFTVFMDRITNRDEDLLLYLKRVAGYCLTGATYEHALFFCHGTGANGKSTFVNLLLGILADYAQVAAADVFTERSPGADRHPTELAALRGARMVIASEVEGGARWAESRVKSLTGGEPISARFMRQDLFQFIPNFKLLLCGNHRPALRNVDPAMARRIQLVPFVVTIPPEERDPCLPEKLKAEWPAILRWAIDGCLEWQKLGLNPPKAVVNATSDYLVNQDALGSWLEECCIVSAQAGATRSSVLHESYTGWAEAAKEPAMSQRRFSDALVDRGFTKRESHGRVFDGIALRGGRE